MSFKQGQVVKSISTGELCLVTGDGGSALGYPVFAGVIISSSPPKMPDDSEVWPVGTYSDSWTAGVFRVIDMDISTYVNAG